MVKIELELKSKGVIQDIAAIETALQGLDKSANDVDLDGLDVDGIADEIDDLTDSFDSLDNKLKNIERRSKNLGSNFDIPDNVVGGGDGDDPDGSTGSGDSVGGDPFAKFLKREARLDIDDILDGDDFNVQTNIFDEFGESGPHTNRNGFGLEQDTMGMKRSTDGEVLSNDRADRIDAELEGVNDYYNTGYIRQELSEREAADIDSQRESGLGGGRGRGVSSRLSKIKRDIDGVDIDKASRRFGKFGGNLRKIIPDMSMFYNVLAAMIPVAIVLGAQLLGVAAAMGAVAVAGAGILALGLVGHGDSMAESFANAKRQLSELARESFNEIQGTASMFSGLQEDMFDAIPERIGDIAESMEGLTAYEDTLFNIGDMFAKGMETAFEAISNNEDQISQLAVRFSQLAGHAITDFFGWLLDEATSFQNMLVHFGSTLKDIAVIVFRVFRVLVQFLDIFSPLINILLIVSRILNTTLGKAMFAFLATTYLLISAMSKLGLVALKAYAFMSGGALASVASALGVIQTQVSALIAKYIGLSYWASNAAAAMALTGIGAIAVAGGAVAAGAMVANNTGGGSPSGSGGGVYNDNREYTINQNGGDYSDRKGMEDTVKRLNGAREAQSVPNITFNDS